MQTQKTIKIIKNYLFLKSKTARTWITEHRLCSVTWMPESRKGELKNRSNRISTVPRMLESSGNHGIISGITIEI